MFKSLLIAVFLTAVAPLAQAAQIQILDSKGQAVTEAKVLIGWAEGDPFAGNLLTTNAQGQIEIPGAWSTALPVTVEKSGVIRSTFLSVQAFAQTLRVNVADGDKNIVVGGTATGFGELRRDGKVDFGLVLPALSRAELLGFDLSSVISPENDIIRIIGREIEIPSNLTLPRQTENYMVPIELNKPTYRLSAREAGTKRFMAAHGQFPLARVVDDIRAGKSLFDVINHFTFISSGARDIEVVEGGVQKDIPVNETTFTGRLTFQAPTIPAGKEVLALSMVEEEGRLSPTDLKHLVSNQRQELANLGRKSGEYVLSLLTNKPEDKVMMPKTLDFVSLNMINDVWSEVAGTETDSFAQLSFVLQDSNSAGAPHFLAQVSAPVIQGNKVILAPPALIDSATPIRTIVQLSHIQKIGSGDGVSSERRTRLWEAFANGWVSEMLLPNVDAGLVKGQKYRWEVLFIGGNDIENFSHVSRNVLEFTY